MCAKPLHERVAEKEAQLQKTMDKAERCKAQLKKLKDRQDNKERKERTHKLIVCGAELAALYGHILSKDEISVLVDFLRSQKDAGIFTFSESGEAITQEPKEQNEKNELDSFFGDFFGFDETRG